ncbi:MAG: DUF4097 domain-containing protein [Actinomycetota bacterium]|nr:DUF4097 domain-containing protein [Actinomycetota bacterium]
MVAQEWSIDGPRVLDIGDEHEQVTSLQVGIVAGRVDVVTHDDSPTARVEVTQVEGLPVRVRWDGGTLRVIHGKDDDANILDMLKRTFETFGRNRAVISISVPVATRASVSTVSAAAVVSGVHEKVTVNTVSGAVTISDVVGAIDLNTVSGTVDGDDLDGPTTVNTVSGSVTLQGSRLPSVDANTVSGDIAMDLTSGAATIQSSSVSGDVTVRAPLTGYDIEGHTATGHVIVDGRTLPRAGRNGFGGPGKGGRLSDGDGSLKVKASAVSGSIVVLRSTATGTVPSTPQDQPPSAGRPPQDRPPQDPPPTSPSPQDSPPEAYRPVDGTDR